MELVEIYYFAQSPYTFTLLYVSIQGESECELQYIIIYFINLLSSNPLIILQKSLHTEYFLL